MADNRDLGFILLWRSFFKDPLWTQLPEAWFRVSLAILAKANYKPMKWFNGTEEISLPAGSLVTSIEELSEFSRVTRQQARAAISYLQKTRFITRHRTHRGTVLSVENWSAYQGSSSIQNTAENRKRTAKEHHGNTTGTHPEHNGNHLTRNKEVKNIGGKKVFFRDTEFSAWAETLYARHPKKGHKMASFRALAEIPDIESESKRAEVGGVHAAWCGSEGWQWKQGVRAPFLDEWATDEGYLYMPPQPVECARKSPTDMIPECGIPEEWKRERYQ